MSFEPVKSLFPFINLAMTVVSSKVVVRGSTVVDGVVEDVLAHIFNFKSRRERLARLYEEGVEFTALRISPHTCVLRDLRDVSKFMKSLGFVGLQLREFVCRHTWKKEGSNMFISAMGDIGRAEFPVQHGKYVRASIRGYWKLERLPPILGKISRTRMTYFCCSDLKGIIPSNATGRRDTQLILEELERARVYFDRSSEIAQIKLLDFKQNLEQLEIEGEEEGLAHGKFEARFKGTLDSSESTEREKITFSIREELETVAAFFWDFDSKARVLLSRDIARRVERCSTDLLQMTVYRKRGLESTGLEHRNRYFINDITFHRIDSDTVVILVDPNEGLVKKAQFGGEESKSWAALRSFERITRKRQSKIQDAVQAKIRSVIRLSRRGRSTKVECALELIDIGGIRKIVSKRTIALYMKQELEELSLVSRFFLLRKDFGGIDQDDARDLGLEFFQDKKALNAQERVERMIRSSKTIDSVVLIYPWFYSMMIHVIKNSLTTISPVSMGARALNDVDAIKIGKALSLSLATTITPEGGVDEWIMQYPALQDLDVEFDWFRTFMVTIADELVGDVPWGLKLRVAVGASMSILDLFTDVSMIFTYFLQGRLEYMRTVISMIFVFFFVQITIVTMNNFSMGKKHIFREIGFILVGSKPGVDAFRVITSMRQDQNQLWNPFMDMTYTKCVELGMESIPGCIIQIFAFMDLVMNKSSTSFSGGSGIAMTSIMISALAAGFTSAQVTYDFDTNPNCRRGDEGMFYGIIPDNAQSRSLCFLCLLVMSASMLLLRCTLCYVLSDIGWKWLVLFLLLDMAIFFSIKVLRGDILVYINVRGRIFRLFVSFFERFVVKLLADFVMIVQMRHPQEFGGLFFSVNYILNMFYTFLSLYLHGLFSENDLGFLWSSFQGLALVNIATTILFLLTVNPQYLPSFWNKFTGCQYNCSKFLALKEDCAKSQVLATHPDMYAPVRHAIHRWIRTNWSIWCDTRPVWFDDIFISNVPPSMVPGEKEGKRVEEINEKRRASSLILIGGIMVPLLTVPMGPVRGGSGKSKVAPVTGEGREKSLSKTQPMMGVGRGLMERRASSHRMKSKIVKEARRESVDGRGRRRLEPLTIGKKRGSARTLGPKRRSSEFSLLE